MTRGKERCKRARKFKPGNGTWFSDEMLFAFTRGLSMPRQRKEHGPQPAPCVPDDAEISPARRDGWLSALLKWVCR